MRHLVTVAWVAVFALFAFGVWAVRQPERAPLSAAGRLDLTPDAVVLTPTTAAPQILTRVVPQIRTVTVPSSTTTTTAPPLVCTVFLVDRCLAYAPG